MVVDMAMVTEMEMAVVVVVEIMAVAIATHRQWFGGIKRFCNNKNSTTIGEQQMMFFFFAILIKLIKTTIIHRHMQTHFFLNYVNITTFNFFFKHKI